MVEIDVRARETDVEQVLREIYHRRQHGTAIVPEPSVDMQSAPPPLQEFENIHLPPHLFFQLDHAARIYDPRTVPGNTRFYRLKALFMRLLRLYTTRQVEFNATVMRILNTVADTFQDTVRVLQYFRDSEVRTTKRIEETERVAGRLSERLDAQRARIEELESYERTLVSQRQRIERLEAREREFDRRLAHVESLENRLQHALAENAALRQRLDHIMLELAAPQPLAPSASASSAPPPSENCQRVELLNEHLYFPYLNEDRGPEDVIRARVQRYLPFFRNSTCRADVAHAYVLDIGCGRGEFLDACRAAGMPARGVDINEDMVRHCRAKGLDVERMDANACLRALPDHELQGIISCHVIEHFTPPELVLFLKLSALKLAPGGRLVLETPNVTSFFALSMFYRDFTHQRPFHPDTVKYILTQCGMQDVTIVPLSPVPDDVRLASVDEAPMAENVNKLNELLYGHLDYAILAVKAER